MRTTKIPTDRRRRYGPPVAEVANYMAPSVGCDNLIDLLHAVEDRWPGLTLHDLIGAMVLAEALAMQPRGRA